ncbi:MAG: caspase family protein [Gammaproteobacteria bacterium]|nr:caspase family protein [Gammaproteobacteria bacterium]
MRHRVFPRSAFVFHALALMLLTLAGCNASESTDAVDVLRKAGCDPARAVETDGYRRLALVVGVGEYAKRGVPDLKGPPQDARRFYELLTGKNGYGFPEENVCMLLDEEATTARFREAFSQALVGRARKGKGDVAVFYYAGHGSQSRDKNGDEPDDRDETLMLHDARTNGVGDLVDDELNRMLEQLHAKTRNVTVILDSCNAGTATRGPDAGVAVARFFEPAEGDDGAAVGVAAGGADWLPADMPGLVTLTAATDSNPALEKGGYGIFTNALISVMSQVGDRPLTYAQLARQTPPLVAAESSQVPYFHGDLARPVFGNTTRNRPAAWEIRTVGPPVELTGPPLPGVDTGAEFRIYDGAATGAETRDPGKAKATVVIEEATSINAKGYVYASKPGAAKLAPGDLAVLVRPADSFVTLSVRLRPANETGGIPKAQAERLRVDVETDPEANLLVAVTEGAGDFELSVGLDGRLQLRGPQDRVRNTYASERRVVRSLWQHARQRALLQLRGEGGADFTDNETLLVSLVLAPKQKKCATGVWQQSAPNLEQEIPLCHAWNVQVSLADEAPVPLLIGALILSTDGSVFALPADSRKVRLQPGETVLFSARRETFEGAPPLDVQDRVLVFGTQETNPVEWGRLTETARTRAARPAGGALQRAVSRYLTPGTRGIGQVDDGPVEDTTWTMSTLTLRVRAN